jgi:ribosomal protein S18 acetylase RimI-like enzyme
MAEMEVSQIKQVTEIPEFPQNLSYFSVPYLKYWAKETLEIGGEVQVSRNASGDLTGLFMYDDYEADGTIFTRSREVFDHFSKVKPYGSTWSELQVDHNGKAYDILTMELEGVEFRHEFKHQVAMELDIDELEEFMSLTVHYALNPKWVRTALANGDRCFAARVDSDIVGVAWLSLVNGIGRVPDLYVKPQFRRTGVARDLFYARLLYLKSQHARSYFAEIRHDNKPALEHALKVGMKVSGQIFEYLNDRRSDA